jgi:glyoxylase-like metal-dependent hydrolase (beta-lactamase superfamily II)
MSSQIFTIKIGINRCYLVKDERTILIDAGITNKIHAFQKAFERLPIHPKEIRLILLTHGDPDHVGSAKDLKTLTGAKIAIHNHDKLNLERSLFNFPPGVNAWGRLLRLILCPILKNVFPRFPAEKVDIVLDENDYSLNDFGIPGKIVYTPGHTQGSVSVLLETGEAFVGCLAHNNLPFRFRPGLPIFADNIEKVKESWNSIIQQGAKTIYPAHGNPFSVDIIKKALRE